MAKVISTISYPPVIIPEHYQRVAGVDEVGRGPLVGDVVAAAVILDPLQPIIGLTDSKKLSEKKRLLLCEVIQQKALAWSLGACSPQEIDQLNIYQATLLAMQRAIAGLSLAPDYAVIDGNALPKLAIPAQAVVKGDLRVAQISAASIVAKVARDQAMYELDRQHPEFGFAQHKGYPTKAHLMAIAEHGVLAQHRRSFAPVKRALLSR